MIKRIGKKGLVLSLLLLTLVLLVSVGSAQEIASEGGANKYGFEQADAQPVSIGAVLEPRGAEGPDYYLVMLADPPLSVYDGGIRGLDATSPRATNSVKVDVASAASTAYLNHLAVQQETLLSSIRRTVSKDVQVAHQYQYALNGVAVMLTPEQAAEVAKLPGVVRVERNFMRQLQTDVGPQWIGAPGIWDGTATGGLAGTMGEGVIVGVIDTGINMDHPSFADIGGDGYDHDNPFGAGNYVGWCDPAHPNYDPALVCNDKLIGVYSYPDSGNNPEDQDGHGSHTASTTAGNFVFGAELFAPTTSIVGDISGVAPHANIIAYDACADAGCPFVDLVAAIDQATADGVDVINYSIGGGTSNPWVDGDALAFLNAFDAGVIPVTSAGNSGPGASTLGSPADAPWMISVGASTHNRVLRNSLINMTSDADPLADIVGKAFTAGYGPAPIVYAGDYPNANDPGGDPAQCLEPYPAGTFSGEIVICDRGAIARVDKGANVLAGGAGGLVLANAEANGASLNGDGHYLPAVHITYSDGLVLKDWVATNANAMATISGTIVDYAASNGDIMASFSSRGPNLQADVIKPDVAAPGVDIWAAVLTDGVSPAPEFGFISGTSMASPHTAGAAALVRALRPDWTAAEVKSALMTTAWTSVLKEDGVTPADPFDTGSGRVDLSLAGQAGFVLDETTANFQAADPALGGDAKTLNLASMADGQCVGTCGWTRTIRSAMTADVEWTATVDSPDGLVVTVTPAVFTLPAGGTQELAIDVDAFGAAPEAWAFASITFTATGGEAPDAHFPVAVVPTTGNLPTHIDIATRRDAGSYLMAGLEAIEITDLTVDVSGLAPATMEVLSLSQDPTNGDPYDNLNDGTTYFTNVTVQGNAARLVAETFNSTAPDVDLFVGTGHTPSAATQVCSSTTGSAIEYCNIDDPAPGQWWILVQNWSESAAPPDTMTLAYASVAHDEGNMWVDGPVSVPELNPFDMRVYWDEPAMEAGDLWYGAFSVGSDPANPGNVGRVNVDLDRLADDVTKTVSAETALPGDTLTYTITVAPNVTPEDLAYTLTDTIPAGMTYVPGSATATDGVVDVVGDTLTWTGTMLSPFLAEGSYVMSTSATDAMCDTGFGGYVDLQAFGIPANSGISGDTAGWTAFSGDPISFYGSEYTGLSFTDDGFAIFDFGANYGGAPWIPQTMPDSNMPNNVAAMYWQDFEIFYDAALNHGVSLATAGPEVMLVEYDDIQLWGGSPSIMDFEIVMTRSVDDAPGAYEIVYAYDNVSYILDPVTIGVENADGSAATTLVNNALGDVSNGFMVCFDWTGPNLSAVEITYQVTVDADADGTYTNNVAHNTDNPGSQEAYASVDVVVDRPTIYLSSNSRGMSGDVEYKDDDIIAYDVLTGDWSMYFDGSDVGLKEGDVDAMHIMDDGSILISFEQRARVKGFGRVDDSDIIRFVPTSLGEDTTGSFEWFFDGSDVGLRKAGEDVDAIGFTPDGRLVISTLATAKVPMTGGGILQAGDEQLIVLNNAVFGHDTEGDWEMYFDGRDVELRPEDIWGTWIDGATGDIYLSMQNEFAVPGASGDGLDIFVCHPLMLGDDTECTFGPGLFFDGSAAGFGGDIIDAFFID